MTEILGVPRPLYARHTPLSDGNAAPRYAPQLLHVIQSLRQQAKNPPDGSAGVVTTALKILHVILALRAGIPPMVCTGSDNALLCPSAGDPRFARMTE